MMTPAAIRRNLMVRQGAIQGKQEQELLCLSIQVTVRYACWQIGYACDSSFV